MCPADAAVWRQREECHHSVRLDHYGREDTGIPQSTGLTGDIGLRYPGNRCTTRAHPDPYPVQHGTRINQTAPGPAFYPPAFTRTYTLRGNAVGLEVDVAEGPLLIYFDIDPMYDCLNDPESCRGTVLVPVNRPYCTITITDNQTHQIVAEDGYAQEYSSQKTNRTIEIFAGGQYRITVTGNSLDITLSVADGSAQQNGTVLTSQPTTSPVSRAEEMQRYGP